MRVIDGSHITRRDEKRQRTQNGIEVKLPPEDIAPPKPVSDYKRKKGKAMQDPDKQKKVRRLEYILRVLGSEKAIAQYFGLQIQRVRVWLSAKRPPDNFLIDLMEFAIASNAERACGFKEFVKKIRLLENIDVTEQENRHLTDRERTIKEIFLRYREERIPLHALYAEYGTDLVNAMKTFFNILDE